MKYSIEETLTVWNDSTGEKIEIKNDSDGLGLIQVRYISSDGKVKPGILLSKAQAELVAVALMQMVNSKSIEKSDE